MSVITFEEALAADKQLERVKNEDSIAFIDDAYHHAAVMIEIAKLHPDIPTDLSSLLIGLTLGLQIAADRAEKVAE